MPSRKAARRRSTVPFLSPLTSVASHNGPRTGASGSEPLPYAQNGNAEATRNQRTADHASTSSGAAYLGEPRTLSVFAHDPDSQPTILYHPSLAEVSQHKLPSVDVQESSVEAYFEYCWPWCPVVDQDTIHKWTEDSPSALFANSLALLGCHIRPPIIEHEGPAEYYHRAKMLFYNDHETNPLVCLQSITLFYWWAPRR